MNAPKTTRLYIGNLQDATAEEVQQFLDRVEPVRDLVLKEKMGNQFGFFECEHPNKFLKISGTRKIGLHKVLITNIKKPQFSREEQAQLIRRENEEYQRQYLQRHPWLVERHECPYVNFTNISVSPADPVND